MEIGSRNLVLERGDTEGITLAAGAYTAGQVVVEGATLGTYSYADVTDEERAYVLLEDVTTATDGTASIGATGTFNENKVTLNNGTITVALEAILQKKGIHLKTNIIGGL